MRRLSAPFLLVVLASLGLCLAPIRAAEPVSGPAPDHPDALRRAVERVAHDRDTDLAVSRLVARALDAENRGAAAEAVVRALALLADPARAPARGRLADATLGLLLDGGHARLALDALGSPSARLRAHVEELASLEVELDCLAGLEENLRVVGPGTGPGGPADPRRELLAGRRREVLERGRLYVRAVAAVGDSEELGALAPLMAGLAVD